MKAMILAAAVAMIGSSALADGFVCDTEAGNLRIKVYHQTQPEMGTRHQLGGAAGFHGLAEGSAFALIE